MDLNLNVLRLAGQLASHATARQQVIAENIAHSDTPGYRARDIEPFADMFERTVPPFDARMTRPGHMEFGSGRYGFDVREVTAFGAELPDGNTVSLEDQMVRAAEVRRNHDMALGVYRKTMDIMRSSLGR